MPFGLCNIGKTTLLDVLSDRKNQGHISGQIYINGYPKIKHHFKRIMAYVEQFDSLSIRVCNLLQYCPLVFSSFIAHQRRTPPVMPLNLVRR